MDDEVQGGWRIDPETRAALRLDRVRKALDQGDFNGAVLEAEELLDEEPDHVEGLFLLAEALLEVGDPENAARTYERHLELVADPDADEHATAWAGLAVARFDCVDLLGAVEAAREAIRRRADLAEAHYYLGLALERLPGRRGEAVGELVAAHHLNPSAYPVPARVTASQWPALLEVAIGQLPGQLQAFWHGVPAQWDELPPLDELKENDPPISPTVSGLYTGTPPERADPWDEKPTAIRFFVGNLVRLGNTDAIVSEMARVLEHEALDWLGTTLEELEA